jgi:hypothetical protein
MEGTVEHSQLLYIIRDHDMKKFLEKKRVMEAAADFLNRKYGEGTVELTITDSYFNMKQCIEPCMFVVERAMKAMEAVGMQPKAVPIRGGTDGARLSYEGLPLALKTRAVTPIKEAIRVIYPTRSKRKKKIRMTAREESHSTHSLGLKKFSLFFICRFYTFAVFRMSRSTISVTFSRDSTGRYS